MNLAIFIKGAVIIVTVVSALAFKVKGDNFCLYELNPSGTCPRVDVIASYTSIIGGGNRAVRQVFECSSTLPPSQCVFTVQGVVRN